MKYLISPGEYPLPNPRIDGWKKLYEVKARAVDIFIFPLEIFDYYKKNTKLPNDFVAEVKKVAEKIIADSPSHAALVRRAFVVPGLENPPGPRFLGLTTPDMVVQAIFDLFKFAVDQKYCDVDGSQISGWIEPPSTILDLDKFDKTPETVAIPYGGYAVAVDGTVEIYSVFGINEGVQSLVADRYLVEFRRSKAFVLKKEVPQKNLMLCTTRTEGKKTLQVPVDLQFDQVLSDSEILEVARVVYELSQKYGPQRVEFSTDEKGICFNEVADFWVKEEKNGGQNLNVRGTVKVIASLGDFQSLIALPKEDLSSGRVIVKISEEIISGRDYDVLGAIAAWRDRFYVLYPGVAATQHAMRILTDKGHKAFLIGNQRFDDGDETQIVVTGGKVRVTNLTNIQSQYVASLWDAALLGVEMCGGKAERLKMAVVVQEMVDASCAGVIFGAKAQTGNLDVVEIEVNSGLGEGIVSGEAQEIEWAIDKAGQIWVLQSRDLYLGK